MTMRERIAEARRKTLSQIRPAAISAFATELSVRARTVEMHAKEIWEIRQELNKQLAVCEPGSELEKHLLETMRHMPSAATAVDLGVAARELRDLANRMVLEENQHAAAQATDHGAALAVVS